METTEEISLVELFHILRQGLGRIIVTTVAGLAIAAVLTFVVMTPKYQSTTDLVVNDTNSNSEQVDQSTLQANLTLLNTYQSIIKKPVVLEKVIEETGVDLSVQELNDMISVQNDNNSLVFSVTVQSTSPKVSATLANSIAKHFSEEVKRIMNVNNVSTLTVAEPAQGPVSPKPILNLLIGAIIGGAIGVIWQLIRYATDRTVKDEAFFDEIGLPVLGMIPEISDKEVAESRLKSLSSQKTSEARRTFRRRKGGED
ncbi:YveK family protein [Aerococcus sp. HMSC06H08]|uniref:YveK family protein n=1 Tax=Aerococcus sp. HMSC06H08 TaxID=1581129 RepID=UPI0008C11648|nr:Wzz/FepE/Etk N-terminal domain-containing protein [Aerococcus sp. HMSC06H08]OFT42702.1 hypothetical protein HMPREF3161_02020 [Aerococcus sp. HMSC06H08]